MGEVMGIRHEARELKDVVAVQALELASSKKYDHGWWRGGTRYPASEKLTIIRLAEQSRRPVKPAPKAMYLPGATFYRWCDRPPTGVLAFFRPVAPDSAASDAPRPGRRRTVFAAVPGRRSLRVVPRHRCFSHIPQITERTVKFFIDTILVRNENTDRSVNIGSIREKLHVQDSHRRLCRSQGRLGRSPWPPLQRNVRCV
jgi:hypothetical protein